MKPDFTSYSLVLLKDDKIVFSSDKPGLRPLVECVNEFKDLNGCVLHDKVIGLAAARLVAYSGIVGLVITDVISKSAQDLLIKNNIDIAASHIVDNILNNDRTSVCPMEKKAELMDNKEFFADISKNFIQFS